MEREELSYIYFVTSNHNKVIEMQNALAESGVQIKHLDIKLPEIQAESLEEVAKYKAKEAYKMVKHPVLVEDAGLFITALNGFPGVYSSYIFKTIGNEGILKLMEGREDRRAKFKAVIAFATSEKDIKMFVGECEGRISESIRGKKGFGFDPIFIPEGYRETFAENYEIKNKVSHRKKAIESFVLFIKEEIKGQ